MTKNDLYDEMKGNVKSLLEKGVNPFIQNGNTKMIYNGASGKEYTGLSGFNLSMVAERDFGGDPRFYSTKDITSLGLTLKEDAVPASYAYFYQNDVYKTRRDEKGNVVTYSEKLATPELKVYPVYNAKQIVGVEPYSKIVKKEGVKERKFDEKAFSKVSSYDKELTTSSNGDNAKLLEQVAVKSFHDLNKSLKDNKGAEVVGPYIGVELTGALLSRRYSVPYLPKQGVDILLKEMNSGKLDFALAAERAGKTVQFATYPDNREKVLYKEEKINAKISSFQEERKENLLNIDPKELAPTFTLHREGKEDKVMTLSGAETYLATYNRDNKAQKKIDKLSFDINYMTKNGPRKYSGTYHAGKYDEEKGGDKLLQTIQKVSFVIAYGKNIDASDKQRQYNRMVNDILLPYLRVNMALGNLETQSRSNPLESQKATKEFIDKVRLEMFDSMKAAKGKEDTLLKDYDTFMAEKREALKSEQVKKTVEKKPTEKKTVKKESAPKKVEQVAAVKAPTTTRKKTR